MAPADAGVSTPGQITAPAQTLYEIVRKLPDGAEVELKFAGEDPRLSVAAGRSRFNLPVLPAGDFPVMSSDGLGGRITLDAADLARLIDKTRFAISTEETRYYLNGLYLHTVMDGGEAKLRAVATDGHRLALAEMAAPEGSAMFAGLPADTRFYFVHSYAARPADGQGLVALTVHDGPFVAAVERGPLWATQFHPEKSGDAGATLLRNWIEMLA